MLRSRWASWGLIGVAVLVLMAFSVPLFGLGGSSHARAAPSLVSPALPRTMVHPAVAYDANVTITSTYPAVVTPPVSLSYTLHVTGVPLSPNNVSVSVAVWAGSPQAEISNTSLAVATGVSSYTISMDYKFLGGYITLPATNYAFKVWVTIFDPNIGTTGSFTNGSSVSIATLKVVNPATVITSTIGVYDAMPIAVTFNVTVNASNSGIVADANNVSVGIFFGLAHGTCIVNTPYGCFTWSPTIIANESLPFNASGTYSVTVDTAFISNPVSGASFNDGKLPPGFYAIVPYVTVMNSVNPSFPQRTVQGEHDFYLATNLPTAIVVSPLNTTGGLTVGSNVSISVAYTGDYVNGATVNVVNQATSALVYTQGVFVPGSGGHAGSVAWVPGGTGNYTISLTVTTPYMAPVVAQVKDVHIHAAAGGAGQISYVNTTEWHNTSLLGGLGPGVAAAVLLVVGLVVGMVVALALGRMMWATGAKATPAQPWTAAKPNECSVCHQSFGTAQELQEHSKQAHGMS